MLNSIPTPTNQQLVSPHNFLTISSNKYLAYETRQLFAFPFITASLPHEEKICWDNQGHAQGTTHSTA